MLSPFPCPGFLYPLQIPRHTNDSEGTVQILALGLSRTGTDSLRAALHQLGYKNVYHGFAVIEQERWTDSHAWYELLDRKFRMGDDNIALQDLNDILEGFVGVSDIPAVLFAAELLDAYPHAKVILNKRDDLGEWKRSFRETTLAAEQNLVMRVLSYFDTELFWLQRTFELTIFALFRGDFEASAENVYTSHYSEIEQKLKRGNRDYLEWCVQDQWEPLCKFLEKDLPTIEFPTGNAKEAHDKRIAAMVGSRVGRAMWNLISLLAGGFVCILATWWLRRAGQDS